MNISQEKTGKLNAIISINLNPEDYQARVDKAIKEQAKKAQIKGFRPGMVPAAQIKKMYGKSILVDEINNILSDTLNNYLTEEKLEVLGQPLPKMDDNVQYNWDFNDQFNFNYEVGLAPAFNVDFSSADKLDQYVIKVDDETLASRIKNLRRSYGKMTNPDVSADGDVLYGEMQQLSPDGAVFEDGIKQTVSIRLENIQDEKIKASLVGLKKDDVVEFDIQKAYNNDAAKIAGLFKIDEDIAADLKSDFRLTVKNVNRLDESDLNQAFFDKIFGEGTDVSTEEQFRAKITAELEGMMVQDADRKLQGDLYNYSLEKIKFDLPDEFLKRWLKVTNEKLNDEELADGYDDFAKNLKWTLITNKIVENNDIKIEYKEVFEQAKRQLDAQFRMYSPQPISEEQLSQYAVQFLQNKENANRIFEEAKALKVLDYIKSIVTLNNKEISFKEFSELPQDK